MAGIAGSYSCCRTKKGVGLLLFIGKIHLKKELFLVQLIMALDLICHAIVFRILLVPCILLHSSQLQNFRRLDNYLATEMCVSYIFIKQDPWYPIRPFVEAFNATRPSSHS